MEQRKKLVEKVKKILVKARDNPNAYEAESAMLMAQRLQLEYNIRETELEERPLEIITGHANSQIRRQHPSWMWQLAHVIANNFRCYVYQNDQQRFFGGNPDKTYSFFGIDDDAAVACEVFELAIHTANLKWQEFRLENRRAIARRKYPKRARIEFLTGFVHGVQIRFSHQVQEYGLVLVKNELVEQQYTLMQQEFSPVNTKSRVQIRSTNAYGQGRADGREFMTLD
ncbi:DUF2786 domain-containing protein [Culicoidibacter larvae]|uniref:DUF2786 domain-containing protein n=1 Tax=Culicoidibacter larvae TaxID=2579976 RepID=A0A5R8QH36_9FIRM|nr:DUF2786 domain-containing protein [Culicoidibacter larvae]TLG77335.1 DUF2786 domain-containing protein [Culicoidibacter larvae]